MYRAIVLVGLLIPGLLSAQSPPTTGGVSDRLEIEVATVKQNKGDGPGDSIRLTPGGQVTVTNMAVRTLIRMSYGSAAIQTMRQVVGGPAWIDTERFDIVAKTAAPLSPRDDIFQVTVRSVLEDRFKITVHTEKREVPIYAIVLANQDGRLGTSLTPSDGKCFGPGNPPPPNTPFDPAKFCGSSGGPGDMRYRGQTIQEIGASLSSYAMIARPVVDRTALTGKYDLRVLFVPAFINSPNGPPVANPAADSGPNIFTALVEQAGLRLQSERGLADFLVIDSVERPTGN